MSCGNFLEYAGSKCGIDVGFGKMILLFAEKTDLPKANIIASTINEQIEDGDIIGVIKGWNSIAGAPVAEINVERTGTGEMKLIRPEILADTLTFENSIVNNEIINDLVKMGSCYGVLLDDQGNAYGDYSAAANAVSTMKLNFSGKTTSSMQKDNTVEKTVAVTVRYLVDDLSAIETDIEVEDVASKVLLSGQLSAVTTGVDGSITLLIKDKSTGEKVDLSTAVVADVTVKGTSAELTTLTASGDGLLLLEFDGTLSAGYVYISISTATSYMKEAKILLA